MQINLSSSARPASHPIVALVAISLLLTACGGGGSGGSGSITPPVATPSPPPVNAPTPNRAPTIVGTPATMVTAGQPYSFQPTASDADGQALTFSVANKPSWAAFDPSSGRLSGTPSSSDVGTSANIVITVTDGQASASLPGFSVTVTAPPVAGIAELQWTAPTRNEDGTALTNLAGYKVRYGQSPSALAQALDVAGASVTSVRIEGLAAGTWYFTVASYTSSGVESVQTGAVSKTIT